jgi:ABC-type lipoprotein release transport system permease subunit
MNPLSPLTYYRRHKRGALLQMALISLATVGLFILVSVMDTLPARAQVSYLTKLSRVSSPTGGALDPATVSQIQTHPDVERIIADNGLKIKLPALFGSDSQRLLGVSPQEAEYLMQHCDVRLKQGRMFAPRSNEFVLSEQVARALDLELGSQIGREVDQDHYSAVPAPLVLVGILEGVSEPGVRLGFVSDEYLDNHEVYAPRSSSLLLVAQAGRKTALDDFLETTISSKYVEVETYGLLAEFYDVARAGMYVVFGLVNGVVAVAVAFVVGVINQLAMSRRLDEFGVLHALGRHKNQLIHRLTLEMAAVAGIGSLMGLAAALAVMSWLKNGPFYELGVDLNLFNPAPFCFVLPIPLVAIALTFWSVRRTFARLDAVSIVEQGKLGQEDQGRRAVKRSSLKPLSSLTFYLRHRRRGILMVLSTALMVLVTAMPVFLLSGMMSAAEPEHEYLQRLSEIYLTGRSSELDPGIVGQIKSHPAVEHTVPAIVMGMQMVLPPGGGTEANVYGVSESDLPILLDLYGLHVQQGRMPQPHTNEMLISAAVAANRGLRVGDVIGGKASSDDVWVVDFLPVEMVVAGILGPDRPWINFASYEYLQNHELTSSEKPNLLIIPRQGQKQALDGWLLESLDQTRVQVLTHASKEREYKEMTTTAVLILALLEYMIAAVAAIALATLNHIFFAQRKQEFGILNAIGRSRRWLVLRTMKETGSMLSIAWIIGALVCVGGLLAVQNLVYGPRSLSIDFFNLMPWLLTMSLPLTVVLISTGTIAWMLSKLDAVSIVERR